MIKVERISNTMIIFTDEDSEISFSCDLEIKQLAKVLNNIGATNPTYPEKLRDRLYGYHVTYIEDGKMLNKLMNIKKVGYDLSRVGVKSKSDQLIQSIENTFELLNDSDYTLGDDDDESQS